MSKAAPPGGLSLCAPDQVNVIAGLAPCHAGFCPLDYYRAVRRRAGATREEFMTTLSRRSLLAGAAAVTAAGSMNAPARAAAPMAGKQGPSFYRYKIGDFEVTALSEGSVRNAAVQNMALNKTVPEIQKAL